MYVIDVSHETQHYIDINKVYSSDVTPILAGRYIKGLFHDACVPLLDN